MKLFNSLFLVFLFSALAVTTGAIQRSRMVWMLNALLRTLLRHITQKRHQTDKGKREMIVIEETVEIRFHEAYKSIVRNTIQPYFSPFKD
ncbi:unnamed protein product [Caenorhabditis nigoni]